MERFDPPEVLDKHTIRFTAKAIHWKNLLAAGGFHVLPKSAFANTDFNTINFEFPVVSGPYKLGDIEEGVWVKLERRSDWWQASAKSAQHKGNFATITYKFFAERTNAFEAFKKGIIDLFPVYTSRIWINETAGDLFVKNHIIKQKIHNHKPVDIFVSPPEDISITNYPEGEPVAGTLYDYDFLDKKDKYSFFLRRQYASPKDQNRN